MNITILDVFLVMAIAFALWGTVRSYNSPGIIVKELEKSREENDKKSVKLAKMQVELDRERWFRRSVEEHYHNCKKLYNGDLPMPDFQPDNVGGLARDQVIDTLSTYFTVDEMASLAYKMGIPFDNIKHTTSEVTAVELTWYMERRNRFDDLINAIDTERPRLNIKDKLNKRL